MTRLCGEGLGDLGQGADPEVIGAPGRMWLAVARTAVICE